MVLITKHAVPPFVFDTTKASPVRSRLPPRTPPSEEVSIKLASPHVIRGWATTHFYNGVNIGAVTSPETLHYRTLKPIFGGLFCERIFGPVKNWECQCGRVRYGRPPKVEMWCPKCVVQITRSQCRRYRFGYIPIGTPIFHFWFSRGDQATNPLKRLLGLEAKVIERVLDGDSMVVSDTRILTAATLSGYPFSVYKWDRLLLLMHANFYATQDDICAPWKQESKVGRTPPNFQRFRFLPNISNYAFWRLLKRRDMAESAKRMTKHLRYFYRNKDLLRKSRFVDHLTKRRVTTNKVLHRFRKDVTRDTRDIIKRRHKVVLSLIFARECFLKKMRPEWVFIQNLPVLPPTLRPILQLENGGLAISDLNELYRLVIFRTSRLRKLLLLEVPEIITCQEIRLVQEAVSAVLDNGRLKYPVKRQVMFEVKESYRSLADRIVGKEGRFRQNLLGKRVDYSGRSVIIVGPTLRLWECGLPYEMAIGLFQPLLIHHLLRLEFVTNVRNAKRFIEVYPMTIRTMLRHLLTLHPILLNRAPTLHRMGIQAFLPRIIPGRAIQLHPFVCPAFNADFDGDQMAVHIPLVPHSIVEARLLLFAPLNWISPATGDPSLLPSQDIVLGIYYLTLAQRSHSATRPTDERVHTRRWVHIPDVTPIGDTPMPLATYLHRGGRSYTLYSTSLRAHDTFGQLRHQYVVTTVGRHLFHQYLPHGDKEAQLPLYGHLV